MYAITGITGKVGGALARALLADGQPVRAVVRDTDKGRACAERGCAVALAEMRNAASLSAAFKGTAGVFILPPSERAEAVPRETWGALFRAQGTKDPMPRIRMLDGFNEGWIDFEGDEATVVKGRVELETVLRGLVSQAG